MEAPLKTKNAYHPLPLAKDTIDVLEQRLKNEGLRQDMPKMHSAKRRQQLCRLRFTLSKGLKRKGKISVWGGNQSIWEPPLMSISSPVM